MNSPASLEASNSGSPSASVERRFYTIVRWFGLVVTSIALGVAVIAAASGLFKLLPQTSGNIQKPTTTYDDFRRSMDATRTDTTETGSDTTLEKKETDAATAAAAAEFERRLKPHLDAIVGNLTSYSEKVNQAKPSAQSVGDYIRSNMKNLVTLTDDEGMEWGYVDGLEKATHDLAADGERLSRLGSDDPRRVRWDNFLDWFSRQYAAEIQANLERINAERARSVADAAEAPRFIYAGAVAFVVFIFGTLLLLMLRIEMNTRVKV
ncbi:MAG: hypothetical protein WBB34_02070 [Xanthobacteraceae bacterium]